MVETHYSKPELLDKVFNNVPELVKYYPTITSLVPYTPDTWIWVIGRPGSTKTSLVLALAEKFRNDPRMKKDLQHRKLAGTLPDEWSTEPQVWIADFDRHLAFMEDETGMSRRNPKDAHLLLPLATNSMLYTFDWIRSHKPKPNLTVIDLSVIPHLRDNGRNLMHTVIPVALNQPGQIHRILTARPEPELIAQIFARRRNRDQHQQYSRNTASADVTEKAFQDEVVLAKDLLDKGLLPQHLRGFENDPLKLDALFEALHARECRNALGIDKLQHRAARADFFRTLLIRSLPTEITSQLTDDVLEQWIHEYYSPIDKIAQQRSADWTTYLKMVRRLSPGARIFSPPSEPKPRTQPKRILEGRKLEQTEFLDPDLIFMYQNIAIKLLFWQSKNNMDILSSDHLKELMTHGMDTSPSGQATLKRVLQVLFNEGSIRRIDENNIGIDTDKLRENLESLQ